MMRVSQFIRRQFSSDTFRPLVVGRYEALLLRVAFSLLVVSTIWHPIAFSDQPLPKGIAHFVDLGFLGAPKIFFLFRILVATAATLYASGFFLSLSLPVLTLCHIAYHTLYNSQGPTHHDHQMISLALLAQTSVVLFLAIFRAVKKRPFTLRAGISVNSLLIYAAQSAIAAVYVTSVLTKLSKSKFLWLFKSHEFAKSLIKTDRQRYYNALDDRYGGAVPAADWIAAHPYLARFFFSGGFFIELLAFMALCNRRWALVIGLALLSLHQGVERLMNLEFYENQWMAVIFFLGLPYWIGRMGKMKKHAMA